jgi:AraC-like DNA-binding protein
VESARELSDALDVPVGVTGISTSPFAISAAEEWDWHRHDADELLWSARGSLVVETAVGFHAVPWTVGLWIPAGEPHRVTASKGTEFSCTFLAPGIASAPREGVGGVGIPMAARALLDELATQDMADETRRLAEQLVPRLLHRAELLHLTLTLPDDDRARRIAEAVQQDPADARTLREWGALVGASERHLARLFRRDSGLSFAEWRTRARMLAAIVMLAEGLPVAMVGRRVGYARSSAFVQAFRRELGTTPGAFAVSAL